jgi:hypothetical protein
VSNPIEAEWVSPRVAGIIGGWSRPTTYKFIAQGLLDARKLGPNKTIISVASIRSLPEKLPKVRASLPKARRRKPSNLNTTA